MTESVGCATHKTLWQAPDLQATQKLFVLFLLERRSLKPTEEQEQSTNSPKEGSPGFRKNALDSLKVLSKGEQFFLSSRLLSLQVISLQVSYEEEGSPSPSPHCKLLVEENTFQQLKNDKEKGERVFLWTIVQRWSQSSPRSDALNFVKRVRRFGIRRKTCNGLKT